MAERLVRQIAVVTSSRADFGHVVWPIKALQAHADFNPILIAMGSHLSPAFGRTVDYIDDHEITVDHELESLLSSDSDIGMAKTIGVTVLGLADLLGKLRPDLLLVTADRYEMLAAASAALALRIPIAHVEGGEISAGAIDDAVRNALTKMSHLHFAPHSQAAQRIVAMGEEAWRVCVSGAPSLDHLRHRDLMPKAHLEKKLGLTLDESFTLVAWHPVTLLDDTIAESDALYSALQTIAGQQIFCFPNSDAGGLQLVEQARLHCAERENSHIFVNLDHWDYWNLLHHAGVMMGNSSSALMEAPSIPLPAINIGRRQEGRLMAANVIDCDANSEAIVQSWHEASSSVFKHRINAMSNPYGDGHAGERMVKFMAQHNKRDVLLNKVAQAVVENDGLIGYTKAE